MVSLAVSFLMPILFPLIISLVFCISVCSFFQPIFWLLLFPPLHLLYHGCITSCVMAEREHVKGSWFEVAVVITGFINPHWMSCLWMHHHQIASWLCSNCLLSVWAKAACRGSTTCRHTNTHTNTNKHIHKCTLTYLNDLKVKRCTVQWVNCNNYSTIYVYMIVVILETQWMN